jgi:hypothetical protein
MANARSSDCTIDTDLLEFHCTAQFRIVEHAHMADDTLDLKTLTDDELVAQMHDDLYDGSPTRSRGHADPARARLGADKVLNDALVEGCGSSASTSATASCSCPRCCWPRTR